MISHDFRHQQRYLVRRVELARLLPGVGGEHTDEIFIDEAENVVILLAVHRYDLYQLDEVADGLSLCAGAVAEF
jgi:hypothetical protein